MKKAFFLAVALSLGIFPVCSVFSAGQNDGFVRVACAAEAEQNFVGNWYDQSGNLIISIRPGVINSCRIVRAYDVTGGNPGSGHFVILEAAGEHDLFIEWEGGYWKNNQYVEPHIMVNHGERLSRK